MKKMFLASAAFLLIILTGCQAIKEWWADNKVNLESYVTTTGRVLGSIIGNSDKLFKDSQAKTVTLGILNEILTQLPETIKYSDLTGKLGNIVEKYVDERLTDDQQKAIAKTAITVIKPILDTTIETIRAKYSTEFTEAENFYTLVYNLLDTTRSTLEQYMTSAEPPAALAAKAAAEEDEIYREIYLELYGKLKAAKQL